MPKKMTRRGFLRKSFGTLFGVAAAGTGGYYYAHEIEPKLLKTEYVTISSSSIPDNFSNLKIIQFSDTHLGFHYDINDLEKLVNKMNQLEPDIVLFTGDLMDEPNMYPETQAIVPVLNKLQASIGKFAIYGNHDHGGYGTDIYKDIIEEGNFTLLKNDQRKVQIGEQAIYILGIDDAMLGKPDIQTAMNGIPNDAYTILLSHAPDLAEHAAEFGINLQLSGHSHGGQIQLPFLGALVKPPHAVNYYEGFYTVGTVNPLTLYVNRGIGTTRLPFRFLCRPELTVFTLKKA
ncbi:metallophosphoesterase [Cytobacillus gottheilii]|uniref:Metallophosphoesterase n=1 Tax=Cytobacillus gottheilii TaxID=859144 RepID=A0ABX8FGI1_9BACI|nr:metallophosphoesterase [Cytobacillus gottheilii]QVY63103.1 metallophosphoesterase [Cytobacillus gottheilii]